MTRIIAGSARGHRLRVPPGSSTRPTADRVREALFSAVESAIGSLWGTTVIDLYAGSGAVGLEALSRGAVTALFVESDPRAMATLQDNVAATRLAGAVMRKAPVERLLAGPPTVAAGFAYMDPPYSTPDQEVVRVLDLLTAWLGPSALVVVERSSRGAALVWPAGFAGDRDRKYGETTLWYGRSNG